MATADLFIKERKGQNGEILEEPWVILRKADGIVHRKLKYRDYVRLASKKYPLKNHMLLHFFKHMMADTDQPIEAMCLTPVHDNIKEEDDAPGIIKITGIDMKKSYKPEEDERYYHFYFKLSERPPERWVQLFTRLGEERKDNESDIRYIWVEEQHIAIRCFKRELRVAYLSDIKKLVKTTNIRYKKSLKKLMVDGKEAGIDSESMKKIAKHMYGARTSLS